MDLITAKRVSDLVRQYLKESTSFTLVEEYETPLTDFHAWANDKDCVGAFRVGSDREELILLFIQWNSNHPTRFTLAVLNAKLSRILADMHDVTHNTLRWRYTPTKHDKRNSLRKERFANHATQKGLMVVNSQVEIPVPQVASEVEQFLITLFLLMEIRSVSDDFYMTTDGDSNQTDESQQNSTSVNTESRYWLMALGPRSQYWEECKTEGIACLGFDDVGDLSKYKNREEINLGKHHSLACWQFYRDMAVGDTIFVKRGRTAVIGHGTVMSDYRYDVNRPTYKNIRDVQWISDFPAGVKVREAPLVTKTLTDVSKYPDQVEALKSAVGFQAQQGGLNTESEYTINSILDDGCFLSQDELSVLLDRLMNKKNLVLQGPPGTGKTWLARRLAYAFDR